MGDCIEHSHKTICVYAHTVPLVENNTLNEIIIMFGKFIAALMLMVLSTSVTQAQKKEMAQAKANVKASTALIEAENSMRKLLADSANRYNEKIWLILFDAVKKQYETLNEQMYLKQATDTAKLFDAAYKMFGVVEGLDSVDSKPNDKGVVKLNYRKKHADYLKNYRQNLLNGGLFFMKKQNFATAWNYFDAYIDCASQPLFEAFNFSETDHKLPRCAFYSMFCGYNIKSAERTLKHSSLAQKDTSRMELVMQYLTDTYLMVGDTAKSIEVLQRGFADYPKSTYFFPHLFDYYFKRNELTTCLTLCNDALAADSTNNIALYAKSTIMLSLEQYTECINICDSLIAKDSTVADPYLNASLAYFNQAVKIDKQKKTLRSERKKMEDLYKKALPYMQTYRKLAPKAQSKWALPLYTIYLNLNMGHEFEEIDNLLKAKPN